MTGILTIKEGDLFAEHDTLCHCVSEDFHMGAGIAVQFRLRYGHVEYLKSLKRRVGQAAQLNLGDQRIFYLVTKKRYFEKPTLHTLRSAIRDMYRQLDSSTDRVTQVSMPTIGCGLDKLEWSDVVKIIEEELCEKGVNVTVCYI